MIVPSDIHIFIYLLGILSVCLTPVYLYRRNWREVGIVASVIIYFLFLNKAFVWGSLGPYHDTKLHQIGMSVFKQWVESFTAIGWNPYMNGGEPYYLYSNFTLNVPWILLSWIDRLANIGSAKLFNLFWTFRFLNFCIGWLLVYFALFDDFRVSLFCFIASTLSGFFLVSLGQNGGYFTIYYLPYILFGIITFCRTGNVYGLCFAIVFFGISMNHYIPLYVLLGAGVFFALDIVFDVRRLDKASRLVKSKYKVLLLGLIMSVVVASPSLYAFLDIQDHVSPTRGGTMRGVRIIGEQTGEQPNVNAPLWGYRVLLEKEISYRKNIHHGFYVGIIPLILIPVALSRREKGSWVAFSTALVFVFLGTGHAFWGYRFLIEHIPSFDLMRHSYMFANFACFFVICTAGFGLKGLVEQTGEGHVKLVVSVLSAITLMALISPTRSVILLGLVGGEVLLGFIVNRYRKMGDKNAVLKQLYVLVVLILVFDLTVFYGEYATRRLEDNTVMVEDIAYPTERSAYSSNPSKTPPDLSPIIHKKATLLHEHENFTFFRNSRLNDMLYEYTPRPFAEQALGVATPLIYFTARFKVLPERVPKKDLIKMIYDEPVMHGATHERAVLFSQQDVDFTGTDAEHGKKSGEGVIKYTRTESPNQVEIAVDVPSDGFLVRLENYHAGWKAIVDGRETQVYRANYAFQAIRIPKGSHEVIFSFSTAYPYLYYTYIGVVTLIWFSFNYFLHWLRSREMDALHARDTA
jgi:hypothetical protein